MAKQLIKKSVLDFNAVFLKESDGGFSVIVPSLPGCVSQGDTFEEALKNIQEAIELYLEGEETKQLIKERPAKEFMVPVRVYGE
jgi:predicted RNase H-like HicB family nuclease